MTIPKIIFTKATALTIKIIENPLLNIFIIWLVLSK
jgi:hypothetical protein